MPWNGSSWGQGLCQFSCFGMRKWMKVAVCGKHVLCTKSVGDGVSLLSGSDRALNLIIILHACSWPVVSAGITLLATSSWCVVFLPDTPGMSVHLLSVAHASLRVFIWEQIFIQSSSDPAAVQPRVSLLERKRQRETLCHCRVRDYKLNCALLGDMCAQKLPASDITGVGKFGEAGECQGSHASREFIFVSV